MYEVCLCTLTDSADRLDFRLKPVRAEAFSFGSLGSGTSDSKKSGESKKNKTNKKKTENPIHFSS